ncbi:MAG: TolC family protein, partial [Acidobacteriales bacterium]|nr:TolC family protein [Terriglobales bacterium]
PYQPTDVPAPSFDNAPLIYKSLIRDGKLYLSLPDAIALALENNLDLAIARYNLPIADTDILRARGGGSTSGVNTGLVSGTQGGNGSGVTTGANAAAQGAGAGGTTAGTGGAGTGSSGLVQSSLGAGPNVPQLDPTLTGTLQLDNNKSLSSNPFSGAPTLSQRTYTEDVAYNQGFLTGTSLSVGFNNTRLTTNSTFASFNPQLNSNLRTQVTQHLLNGFGISNNNRFIRIALNDKQIANYAFRQQVNTTVSQIEDIYWDLVNAYENVVAQERSVSLGQKLLSDNQRQVQIGTLAPIAVVQAQSQLATSQQNLIVAQTNLQLQQYLMLNAVARNVSSNLQLSNVKVIPTDRMDVSAYTEQNLDTEKLIQTAYSDRPDIQESLIDLKNREITRKSAKNALLPTVDLYAYYGGSSLAGNQNPLSTCRPGQTTFCTPPGAISPTGYGTAFSNLFNGTAPDKGAGINVAIPIRNRVNQATQIRSELEEEQAKLRLLQLRNQVTVDVRNAVYAVAQDRAQVDAARAAQEYAQQNLEAEQKKYQLGASTSYNVQQLQTLSRNPNKLS